MAADRGLYINVGSTTGEKFYHSMQDIVNDSVKQAIDEEFGSSNSIGIDGIAAEVSTRLAQLILNRAKYYCPVDTGKLKSSGRVEHIGGGKSMIIFDCDYAWYVHEHTWKKHAYPTCAKFLTRAVNDILGTNG